MNNPDGLSSTITQRPFRDETLLRITTLIVIRDVIAALGENRCRRSGKVEVNNVQSENFLRAIEIPPQDYKVALVNAFCVKY
uniref:Uncharacterized protein n=1 Tax=Caenorhabditis tropicalis TaxID=1561998 RepID=A0A1I7UNT9_9PELO